MPGVDRIGLVLEYLKRLVPSEEEAPVIPVHTGRQAQWSGRWLGSITWYPGQSVERGGEEPRHFLAENTYKPANNAV